MIFIVAQGKALLVGFCVLIVWATLDWLAVKHGLPFGAGRNYFDSFFGAVAGASVVFTRNAYAS